MIVVSVVVEGDHSPGFGTRLARDAVSEVQHLG